MLLFATPADQEAWEFDFGAFGMAMLDERGKHVPLDRAFEKDTIINAKLSDTHRREEK